MTVIVNDPQRPGDVYCVYEHLMQFEGDGPPRVIYVNTCKLIDVFRLAQGKKNTEWVKLTASGVPIMVNIVATGLDRVIMQRQAMVHSRSFSPMPICNIRGFSLHGQPRKIYCSNGKEYETQADAALDLGVNQSAISKHLRGGLHQVNGFVFSYMPVVAVEPIP